jgi:hypothetical protein
MIVPPAVGNGREHYVRRSPGMKDFCEAYEKQSRPFSKGLSANVMDGGGVTSFHIRFGFEDRWRIVSLWIREGKYLGKATVKGDKILLDQVIPGFQVVIEVHLQ